MKAVTAEQVLGYLNAHYLTLEQLAERAGLAPERVVELEQAQCIPAASYRVEGEFRVASTFGHFDLPVPDKRYYHPSIARWIEKAEALAKSHEALTEVARIMRLDFTRELATRVNGRPAPKSLTSDQAWAYVTDGTWGLCLKDIVPANMVAKELARAAVAAAPDQLSSDDRKTLQGAVADYEAAALPFAPHELAESSRKREIEPAVAKHGL